MNTVEVAVPSVVPRSILSKTQKHSVISILNRRFHAQATKIERSADDMNDIVVVTADAEPAVIEGSIKTTLLRSAS
jgi:hypothetical protein